VPDPPVTAVIVDRAEEAAVLMAKGTNVVLVVDAGADPVALPAAGPGRVAVMVGRLDDAAVRAAAEEMAAELFGVRAMRAAAVDAEPGHEPSI
jgi:hypothetical protein